jgi:hypothetical protein
MVLPIMSSMAGMTVANVWRGLTLQVKRELRRYVHRQTIAGDKLYPGCFDGETAAHALSCAPVIGLLLVVQVPDASDVGCMAVLLRPFDCLALRLEGGKDVVRVVLDNIIIDSAALCPTLRPCLNVNGRHFCFLQKSHR